MKKLVSKTLANSPMTEARKKKLKALAAQPDGSIDLLLEERRAKSVLPASKAAIDGKVGRRCGGVVKAAG